MSDLLLIFYGDDFTGSTDVMEVLARAGISTALFLEPPTPDHLARFPAIRAFGVAGSSRSMTPAQMQANLQPLFESLREWGAPIVHYKVCSTFDSAPHVGSIGRAMEIGRDVFGSPWIPLVVGAPPLARYCVFGNLFARSGLDSAVTRLDRHPAMSRHPVTPMDESDLRLHLARQTDLRVALLDVLDLIAPSPEFRLAALLAEGADSILFDILTDDHLRAVGRLIWEAAYTAPLFAIGSSGVEYALVAYWREKLLLPDSPSFAADPVQPIVAVSGSCSPVTDRQIGWAVRSGFSEIPLDAAGLADSQRRPGEVARAVSLAVDTIKAGRSPILHTSRGPDDPRIAAARPLLVNEPARILGTALGEILYQILVVTGLQRAATTGGDTSYYIARALGIEALEFAAPCAPGSPLCRIQSRNELHGREVVFKGGQVGKDDFFLSVIRGAAQ